MSENTVIVYNPEQAIQQAQNTRQIVWKMREEVLIKDHDFGVVPGTDKPTLLKPGAEKLCTAFSLRPKFKIESIREDFEGGLFHYRYECTLVHIPTGLEIASGIGSCNSYEDKYRWRKANRKCPNCQAEAIIKGKQEYGGGWICFSKKGGCGAKFAENDSLIMSQEAGRVINDDPFTLVNTIDKMAQKRALIGAVLVGTNASEFFTQDVEDMPEFNRDQGEVVEGKVTEIKTSPEPPAKAKNPQPGEPPQPPANGNGDAPIRPYASDQLYARLVKMAELENLPVAPTEKHDNDARNLAIEMQRFMSDKVRVHILEKAFGVQSSKLLTQSQLRALQKWVGSDEAILAQEVSGVEATLAAKVEG